MTPGPVITRIGNGMYRVDVDGRAHIVYVAGSGRDRWVHWDGHVFHRAAEPAPTARAVRPGADSHQVLSAPMPGTVLSVSAAAGTSVRKGDTLIVLEAMKMELPIRAPADGLVRAVRCREGELVQPGAVLVELE